MKHIKYFVVFIMCYASFQYGRIHDEGVEYYSAEENIMIYKDRCQISADSLGNPYLILYNDRIYNIVSE